jgi:hypothetical protein
MSRNIIFVLMYHRHKLSDLNQRKKLIRYQRIKIIVKISYKESKFDVGLNASSSLTLTE